MDLLSKMLGAGLDGVGQLSSAEVWLALGALAYAGGLLATVVWATRTFEPPANDVSPPGRRSEERSRVKLVESGRRLAARA